MAASNGACGAEAQEAVAGAVTSPPSSTMAPTPLASIEDVHGHRASGVNKLITPLGMQRKAEVGQDTHHYFTNMFH
jgi:hypothetical protein